MYSLKLYNTNGCSHFVIKWLPPWSNARITCLWIKSIFAWRLILHPWNYGRRTDLSLDLLAIIRACVCGNVDRHSPLYIYIYIYTYCFLARITFLQWFRYWYWKLGTNFHINLGLYSLSGKTSYRQISWSFETARLGVIINAPLWNLTGTWQPLDSSAAEGPVKFHCDWKSLNPNLATSGLYEILREDVLPLSE